MLDAIRGVAILMVVAYHGLYWYVPHPDWLSQLARMGWLGVQLFFVLSGYFMTRKLLALRADETRPYYREFYKRRVLRIVPALAAMLLVLILTGTIHPAFFLASVGFAANLTALLHIPFEYGPLWSLSVEEQFYFAWPGVVRHTSRRTLTRVALGVIAFVLIARTIGSRTGIHDEAWYYTWFVADGLALGALVALQPERMRHLWVIGLPLALVSTALHLTVLKLLPWELCFASVVAWGAATERSGWRVLRFFGDISYGLYLVHLLIFQAFDRLYPNALPIERLILAGSVATVIAALSRWTFEEYFLGWNERRQHVAVTV